MKKSEACKIIGMFMAAMPNVKLETEQIDKAATIWSVALADIPYAVAEKAMIGVLRTRTISCLPMPAEIVNAVFEMRMNQEIPGIEAWNLMWEMINEHAVWEKGKCFDRLPERAKMIANQISFDTIIDTYSSNLNVLRTQFIKLYEQSIQQEKATFQYQPELKSITSKAGKANE